MGQSDTSQFKHLTFEDAYAKLEKIVEQLETSSLPLDESLALFEEGQQLSAYCQQLLDKAELRVNTLVMKDGKLVEEPEAGADAEAKDSASAETSPQTDTQAQVPTGDKVSDDSDDEEAQNKAATPSPATASAEDKTAVTPDEPATSATEDTDDGEDTPAQSATGSD